MFTRDELVAIASLVEDALPLLDIIKRRTGVNVDHARLVYAMIAAKAQDEVGRLDKAEAALREKP